MAKLIVSDTSCLIALSSIGKLDLLLTLSSDIFITQEVFEEYKDSIPDWIKVKSVVNKSKQIELENILDRGEASSIALSLELDNSILVIDEIKGRKIAENYKIEIIGTIGLILLAQKKLKINDALDLIKDLVQNGFRLSNKLIEEISEKLGK